MSHARIKSQNEEGKREKLRKRLRQAENRETMDIARQESWVMLLPGRDKRQGKRLGNNNRE